MIFEFNLKGPKAAAKLGKLAKLNKLLSRKKVKLPVNTYRYELIAQAKELNELLIEILHPYRDVTLKVNKFIAKLDSEIDRVGNQAADEKSDSGYKPPARHRLKVRAQSRTNPDRALARPVGTGRGKGKRHCGVCGKTGHKARTDPRDNSKYCPLEHTDRSI